MKSHGIAFGSFARYNIRTNIAHITVLTPLVYWLSIVLVKTDFSFDVQVLLCNVYVQRIVMVIFKC